MSAPQLDTVEYNGRSYRLSGSSHAVPPTPKDFGIHKLNIRWQSNNLRGFQRGFEVHDHQLILTQMTLLGPVEDAKPINGVKPKRRFRKNGNTIYKKLNVAAEYTGKLLIVDEFVEMVMGTATMSGFNRPHMCRFVHELWFEAGNLVDAMDHGEKMDRLRDYLRQLLMESEATNDNLPPLPKNPEDKDGFDAWLKAQQQDAKIKREAFLDKLKLWAVDEYGADYDAWWLVYVP